MLKLKKINETYCQVGPIHEPDINLIIDYCRFRPPGYQYNKAFPKYWNGYIDLLDETGKFPLGLYRDIINLLDTHKIKYVCHPNLIHTPPNKSILTGWLNNIQLYDGDTEIVPHWYQEESFVQAIQDRRLLINLPTSAGKSLVIGLIARYLLDHGDGKILILVPTITLTTQMRDDLVNYRLFSNDEILTISSGSATDSDSRVYISTWQSAGNQPIVWLQQFQGLICDEVHKATAKIQKEIAENMFQCSFKVGLTGTLKKTKAHITVLKGLFGGIIKPTTTKKMISENKASRIRITIINLKYPDSVIKQVKKDKNLITKSTENSNPSAKYNVEIDHIVNNEQRNRLLCQIASSFPNENILLLFRLVEHGNTLADLLKSRVGEDRVHLAHGKIKKEIREQIRDKCESSVGNIIVASYNVFSTGISIKNLHRFIFGHPIKSEITTLQSIGRVLRKHESKEQAVVYDIIDNMGNNYAKDQGVERISYYNQEQFNYTVKSHTLSGLTTPHG